MNNFIDSFVYFCLVKKQDFSQTFQIQDSKQIGLGFLWFPVPVFFSSIIFTLLNLLLQIKKRLCPIASNFLVAFVLFRALQVEGRLPLRLPDSFRLMVPFRMWFWGAVQVCQLRTGSCRAKWMPNCRLRAQGSLIIHRDPHMPSPKTPSPRNSI